MCSVQSPRSSSQHFQVKKGKTGGLVGPNKAAHVLFQIEWKSRENRKDGMLVLPVSLHLHTSRTCKQFNLLYINRVQKELVPGRVHRIAAEVSEVVE